MSGLSRRAFLGATAALAAAWALPERALGTQLFAPLTPAEVPSTLLSTIRFGSIQQKNFRKLISAAGEPYVARFDLLGKTASASRSSTRRSLFYGGHLSDLHIIDAQSPARLEPLIAQSHKLWGGAFRPQDTLTTHVASAMVKSVADVRVSPLTGAPLAAAFVTGDSADMLSELELRWYINILDGKPITPNSGAKGVYDGVQDWQEAFWAYRPERSETDWFKEYGFPEIPGMLEAAVSNQVSSVGLPVPWFAVYGNHDTTYFGTLGVPDALRSFAVGNKKFFDWPAEVADYFGGWAADASAAGSALHALTRGTGATLGARTVTADPARKLLEQQDFMKAHFETQKHPGPIGHGFTQENLTTGKTYWSRDVNPFVRVFGLDTCNQVAGPDGAVSQEQFEWLEQGIAKAQAEGKLVMVLSHHNSFTLENDAELATNPQKLIHAEEFIAMLTKYPAMVAWLNGHTHNNTITAHRGKNSGGFWEITTASCIDFPQQQQTIEIVDNADGTLSIFTTVLDHASPAEWNGDLNEEGLASLSRLLAANDWIENPVMRQGSELDRNTELLLPAPFDLSKITPAQLELAHAEATARNMAWQNGWAE